MGCVSSKHIKKDSKKDLKKDSKKSIAFNGGSNYTHHVVSLTSSTYGALKLDKDHQPPPPPVPPPEQKNSPPRTSHHGPPEIINAWELMKDLEDEAQGPVSVPGRKSPKLRRGIAEIDVKTPMKIMIGSSPKVSKRFTGKENKKIGLQRSEYSPKTTIVKASTLPANLRISKMGGCESPVDSGLNSARRKNLGPLFDPGLVDPKTKRKFQEREQIKKEVLVKPTSQKSRNTIDSTAITEVSEKKCPPTLENVVVIYTTTLRGIRKTFEDCNIVRGIIESHKVRMIERDVSMDSGFKEELRTLLGKKEVKVPVVLVKGRLIAGSEEIMKLEEEGKLRILLDGIPMVASAGCKGCGGVRFMMCTVCNGSCKLIGGDGRRSIKCLECNENGLVQCPICC